MTGVAVWLAVMIGIGGGCGGTDSNSGRGPAARANAAANENSALSLSPTPTPLEVLERAFDESSPLFARLGTPKPGEWRQAHPEPDQTFEQFEADDSRQIVTEARRTIVLQPLGEFSSEAPSVEMLKAYALAYFQLPVRVLPPLDSASLKLTTRTNQYTGKLQILAGDVLKAMAARLPEDAYCMVAITMTDLYPEPSWNFVFGQASLTRRVGVFSFARYHPSFWNEKITPETPFIVLRRSCSVMTHEIGHMFGMHHCTFFSCNMCGSNSQAESDSRPIHLCPVCLKKLRCAVGFNVLERERGLEAFYATAGLKSEAAWTQRRVKELAGQ